MYRQYLTIKAQHPDSILLFRIGDFYETFDEDAKTFAQVCDIALTHKVIDGVRRPLAGVPYAFVNGHVDRLLEAGYTVAVVDQANDAGGKIVQRAVY